ncbi:MAG: polyamine transporter substrate-binding protein [Pedosphaera sp.]|nr:polyamine transporter substrate-binding protein [Pedosphaera sp.]
MPRKRNWRLEPLKRPHAFFSLAPRGTSGERGGTMSITTCNYRDFTCLKMSPRPGFMERCVLICLLRFCCIAFLGLNCCSALQSAPQKLNLFIWSEYIDPKIVSQFEQEQDCKVNIDLYEDAESMLAKMQGGGASLYDVVVPPDHIVPAMVKLNLLAPLRHENIPNLTNLDEKFTSPPYDRGNRFTVAYQWGTVGLFVRQPKGEPPLTPSWALFFDPAQQAGSFVLIDSVRDMIGAALKYNGCSLNSTDPKQLKAARDLVIEAKKRSIGFEGSVGAKNKVLAKTARVAIVYSGEGVRGMTEDKETVFLIPRECSQIWLDNLAVPAHAPHRELAEKFLNFILDAKIGAQLSAFTQFASPNQAARQFIPPADLNNPAIYPPAETMSKLEFLEDLGGKTRIYDEIWTQVKAK